MKEWTVEFGSKVIHVDADRRCYQCRLLRDRL
jgi:hypothetical protein